MDTVVLIAIPEEAPLELQYRDDVFFTGVGKVNAALCTARIIEQYKPKRVINFGTAGGITVGTGLYQCTRFVQRDMDCKALGFEAGQTPYEFEIALGTTAGLTCSTGDNFVFDPALEVPADLVDMEAYAIAKAVWRYNLDKGTDVSVYCWKYVSNKVAHGGGLDWQLNVDVGQELYKQKYKEFHELIPNSGLLH